MVFDIPPGHDGWVIGDEPWETYDFAGMRAFGRTIDPTTASSRRSSSPMSSTRPRRPSGWATRGGARRSPASTSCASPRWTDSAGGSSRRPATGSSHCSTAPSERSGRPRPASIRRRGSGSRSVPECTRARWRLSPGDVRGLAVHVASRIMGLAGGGEVYVSGTTYELIGGSSVTFEDRGEHELKGVSGRRRAYRLVRAAG